VVADEIVIEVAGWPPQKNEAKSMFAADHSLARRVTALLEAARDALPPGWVPLSGPVGVEVIVRGPGRPPADATNYLGGIGDVLQDKSRTLIDLSHLGELCAVVVFDNDRQICQIAYQEERAESASYSVRVFAVSPDR
jgi:hypothetical protein